MQTVYANAVKRAEYMAQDDKRDNVQGVATRDYLIAQVAARYALGCILETLRHADCPKLAPAIYRKAQDAARALAPDA